MVNVHRDRFAVSGDDAGGDLVEGVAALAAALFEVGDVCSNQGSGFCGGSGSRVSLSPTLKLR